MALSLMVKCDDVRLAEQPAHSLCFMGTKWIDLWVVYEIFAQAPGGAGPLSLSELAAKQQNQEAKCLDLTHERLKTKEMAIEPHLKGTDLLKT